MWITQLMSKVSRRPGNAATGVPAPSAAAAQPDIADPRERAIYAEIQSIIDRTLDIDLPNFRLCSDHFRQLNPVLAQYRTAKGHLEHVRELPQTVGLDFACWCGFMTYMMHRLGAGTVWGADVVADHIVAAQRWTAACGVGGIHFKKNPMNQVPFDDGMFDWTIVSGLYSNLNPEATAAVFAELHRVLKPGGLLLFNDGGNVLHAETAARIARRHAELELGHGTEDEPAGEFVHERRKIICELRPCMDSANVARLAAETCGMWRPQIEVALEAFEAGRARVASRFHAGSGYPAPVDPYNGNAAARANEPFRIKAELEAAGFAVAFTQAAGSPPLTDSQAAAVLPAGPGIFIVARKKD